MRRLLLLAFLLLGASPAFAQSNVLMNFQTPTGPVQASAAHPVPVTGSFSATTTGYAPSLAYGTCTATGSACASTALPANTGSVILFNAGTTTVSCTLASGAATALANELQIPASSGLPLNTTYGATTYDHFSCIDQTGSASNVVIASGGSGLPTGWGGGGGGGSGGASAIDEAAFTYGSSSYTPIGGVYNSSITALTSGQGGAAALTPTRSVHATPYDSAGGDMTDTTNHRLNVNVQNTAATSAAQSGTWTVQPGNTANTTPWLVQNSSGYPSGATAITASATGTTLATTATLAAAVGKTTYICSLSIRSNATAAATGNATVTGTITGTLNYTHWTAPLASGVGVTEQVFTPCVPGSATNTAIAVASPAPGSGGTVSVSASGYQL